MGKVVKVAILTGIGGLKQGAYRTGRHLVGVMRCLLEAQAAVRGETDEDEGATGENGKRTSSCVREQRRPKISGFMAFLGDM